MTKHAKFNYQGQTITFEFTDGNKMINATQMAKPFKGKMVADFLRLKNTKEFILALQARYGDSHNRGEREALRVVQGGTPELQGTWMDELLALKFAAWLSPHFEIWMYERIQELLLTGRTELQSFPSGNIIQGLRMIVEQLEEQQHFNVEIRGDVNVIRNRVDELEAKITSTNKNYYTIAGYCSLLKIPCPLHQAKAWGKAAAILSRKQNIPMGTAHDERFGKVRTYHKDILKVVVK